MKTNQEKGRLIGALLLLIVAFGIPSVMFRGLSVSMTSSPDFLKTIFEQALQMRFAVLLDILSSALWVIIAIILFPMIKGYKHTLALWFFGIWLVQLAVIVYSDIVHLSLLSLSEAYVKMGAPDLPHFKTMGLLKIEEYFWGHFMSIMLFAAATWVFYYFLFKTKLIPRILSVWGMIAISLVFLACWLNIFDRSVSFYFFAQNGIHLMTLLVWLLVKGFRSPEMILKTN